MWPVSLSRLLLPRALSPMKLQVLPCLLSGPWLLVFLSPRTLSLLRGPSWITLTLTVVPCPNPDLSLPRDNTMGLSDCGASRLHSGSPF